MQNEVNYLYFENICDNPSIATDFAYNLYRESKNLLTFFKNWSQQILVSVDSIDTETTRVTPLAGVDLSEVTNCANIYVLTNAPGFL